jgi:hypothetical protein
VLTKHSINFGPVNYKTDARENPEVEIEVKRYVNPWFSKIRRLTPIVLLKDSAQ